LYVIDMQNDFVDRAMPEGSEQLTGPPFGESGRSIGEFAVGQGKVMIPELIAYIKAAKNTHKSIVLSRDYHPSDHCSFGSVGGYFPVHCVQKSLGAEFIPELNALKGSLTSEGGAKTTVIFKGFDKDVDSFSAAPFYANQTSSGPGCLCKTTSCSGDTIGGYTIPGDAWARDAEVSSTTEFNLNPTDGDVIEVCGLAGDYCVRDTAIALKIKHPNCKVVVLNHLTRYAFLPTQIFLDIGGDQVGVGSFPQHNNKITSGEKTMGEKHLDAANIGKFLSNDPNKGFNYYLFTPPPTAQLLSAERMATATSEQIKRGEFCHFITDHNTIINDYAETGVQLYIPQEIIKEVQ
jgi:nicotinamidase-related amidase